jgi:hypothetical protein
MGWKPAERITRAAAGGGKKGPGESRRRGAKAAGRRAEGERAYPTNTAVPTAVTISMPPPWALEMVS